MSINQSVRRNLYSAVRVERVRGAYRRAGTIFQQGIKVKNEEDLEEDLLEYLQQ